MPLGRVDASSKVPLSVDNIQVYWKPVAGFLDAILYVLFLHSLPVKVSLLQHFSILFAFPLRALDLVQI